LTTLKVIDTWAPRVQVDGTVNAVTARSGCVVVDVKVAVTVAAAFMTTVQAVAVPLQAVPLQPANREPDAALAVRVTRVPDAKPCVQSLPQLIPEGELVTVPDPLPERFTVSVLAVDELNVAVIPTAALRVTLQLPVPLQPPPLHPAKVDPDAGLAVNVTRVPDA
jgi:hypothetical protein